MQKLLLLIFIFSITLLPQTEQMRNKFMLAESYERAGDYEKANEIYGSLHVLDASNYSYFSAYVRTCQLLKLYDDAEKAINNRIQFYGEDLQTIGMLGKNHFYKGDENQAFAVWDDYIKRKGSTDPFIYKQIASFAMEIRAFDKAISYLLAGLNETGQIEMYGFDLAYLYGIVMNYERSAAIYREMLEKIPQQAGAVEAHSKRFLNNREALEIFITVMEQDSKVYIPAVYKYLASLYVMASQYDDALRIYLLIDESSEERGMGVYNFGMQAFYASQFEPASRAFEYLINKYPNANYLPNIKLHNVKALEGALQIEFNLLNPSWKENYEVKFPDKKGYYSVIEKYEEVAKIYLKSEVETEALFRIAAIYYLLGLYDESKEFLQLILDEKGSSPFASNAYYYLGLIQIQENRLNEAIQMFKKSLLSFTTEPEMHQLAKYNLMMTYIFLGDFESASPVLIELMGNLKDNLANDVIELSIIVNKNLSDSITLVKFGFGELQIRQGNFDTAIKIFEELASNKEAFFVSNLSLFRIAEIYAGLNKYDEAIIAVNRVTESENNIYADRALMLLAAIYKYGINDNTKAIETYEKVLINYPNSIFLDKAREEILAIKNLKI